MTGTNGHTITESAEFMIPGALFSRARDFFNTRADWIIQGACEGSGLFRFAASFGGVDPYPKRCTFQDLGIQTLDVLVLGSTLSIISCGATNGCEKHNSTVRHFAAVSGIFISELVICEQQAESYMLDALVRCALTGECSHNEILPHPVLDTNEIDDD